MSKDLYACQDVDKDKKFYLLLNFIKGWFWKTVCNIPGERGQYDFMIQKLITLGQVLRSSKSQKSHLDNTEEIRIATDNLPGK